MARVSTTGRVGLGLLAASALVLAGACSASSDEAGSCRTGSDCPSGACEAGRCVAAPTSGTGGAGTGTGGGDASSGGGAQGGSDSSTGAATGSGGEGGGGLLCAPEGDGSIRRDEVPLVAGFRASYLAATDAPFATAGTEEDGERVWAFDVDLPGDHLTLAESLSLETQWFATVFPGASYAGRLSEESLLLGVFEATDDALLLRGVVSPTDGASRTELTYEPPVTILAFPLEEGDTWSTSTTVTGVAQGVFVTYTEEYSNAVDARGTSRTPYADFDTLRVRVELERTVGFLVTTQRTFAFVAECFGTVARVVSQQDEASVEFDEAAEVWRLSP